MANSKSTSVANYNRFNNISIKSKLAAAFAVVTLIFLTLVLFIQYKLTVLEALQADITELRMPTNIAGHDLVNGINHSLASLRGYMILGKDSFKKERLEAWKEINKNLSLMTKMSKNWTVPKNIEALDELKLVMADFNIAQQQVEKISHTKDEQPAIKILITEAAPRAEKIVSALNQMINEEKKQLGTVERKALLGMLADSRGSFSLALASIRGFLINGDKIWLKKFDNHWKVNSLRLKSIQENYYLLTDTQINLHGSTLTYCSTLVKRPVVNA